jgi:hypothetical protein
VVNNRDLHARRVFAGYITDFGLEHDQRVDSSDRRTSTACSTLGAVAENPGACPVPVRMTCMVERGMTSVESFQQRGSRRPYCFIRYTGPYDMRALQQGEGGRHAYFHGICLLYRQVPRSPVECTNTRGDRLLQHMHHRTVIARSVSGMGAGRTAPVEAGSGTADLDEFPSRERSLLQREVRREPCETTKRRSPN